MGHRNMKMCLPERYREGNCRDWEKNWICENAIEKRYLKNHERGEHDTIFTGSQRLSDKALEKKKREREKENLYIYIYIHTYIRCVGVTSGKKMSKQKHGTHKQNEWGREKGKINMKDKNWKIHSEKKREIERERERSERNREDKLHRDREREREKKQKTKKTRQRERDQKKQTIKIKEEIEKTHDIQRYRERTCQR